MRDNYMQRLIGTHLYLKPVVYGQAHEYLNGQWITAANIIEESDCCRYKTGLHEFRTS